MKYSNEQIGAFADEHVRGLMNGEDLVDNLRNDEVIFFGSLETEYSEAMRNANPNSRLFKATFEG